MGILRYLRQSADNMVANARYSLPDCTGSWVALLVYIVFGLLTSISVIVFPFDITRNQLLTYIVTIIPPFAYLMLVGRKQRLKATDAGKREGFGIGNTKEFKGIPIIEADNGKLSVFSLFFIVTLLTVVLQIATDPLTSWMTMPDYFKQLLQSLINGSTGQIIAIVVAAPLLEELLLRGFIERGMIYHSGGTKAIIISACIFGVMHLNPWQALPAFIMGLVFGWIYWRTHNLWLTILMHFLTNGTSVITTRLFPEYSMSDHFLKEIMRDYAGEGAYIILVTACAVITAALLYFLNRKLSCGKELFPTTK